MCPVELGGQQIAPGDRVLLSWAAANRDETVFPEPDQLLINRLPNRHTSFGLGAHRCIGSNYARDSFATMLRAVLIRMPDYVIDAEAEPNASIGVVNGWVNLPARFSPGRRSRNPRWPSWRAVLYPHRRPERSSPSVDQLASPR